MSRNRKMYFAIIFSIVIIAIFFMARCANKYFREFYAKHTIWGSSPTDNYKEHHVFGMITLKSGAILVFCEERVAGSDTSEPHDIVMRTSNNNGRTWSNSVVIVNSTFDLCVENENEVDGRCGHCYVNPTPVWDSETNTVFLFYAENFNNNSTNVYVIKSTDEGNSWSEPVEITSLFDDDPERRDFHLPGPGHGIQMEANHKGRLVVSFWHRKEFRSEDREYGGSCIYSDDNGVSWNTGEYISCEGGFGEGRISEDSEGNVVLNARSTDNSNTRIKAISLDGGITWSKPEVWDGIENYVACDSAFLITEYEGEEIYIMSHPTGDARDNISIFISSDGGESWNEHAVYTEGNICVGYTEMCIVNKNVVGLLYPHSGRIIYKNISIADLLE